MFRYLFLTLALVAPLVLAMPANAAETPTEGRCDPTSLLVCALAGAGATATCATPATGGVVSGCSVSFGWGWQGFSRAGVPGDVVGAATGELLLCRGMGGCTMSVADVVTPQPFACSWVGPVSCESGGGGSHDFGGFTLALGECVRVGVRVTASTFANAGAAGESLASANYTDVSDGAAGACYDDNGRD